MGGGILAVSPGRFGIAVIAPPLDGADILNALGGNPYAVKPR